jgi:hypothetical protein
MTPLTFVSEVDKNSTWNPGQRGGVDLFLLFLLMGSGKQIKGTGGAAYVRMRVKDRKWSFARQRELAWSFASRRGLAMVAEQDGGGVKKEGGS